MPLKFTFTRRVQFFDTDMAGIVHFANFYRFMEEAEHEMFRSLGFKIEDDLNTEKSRRLWLDWKRRVDPSHYLDPHKRAEAGHQAALQMVREGLIRAEHLWGTINCDGVNAKGEICGVTTTSGLSW